MFVSESVYPLFSLTHPKKNLVTRLCLKSPSKRFTTLQIHGAPKNATPKFYQKFVHLRKTSTLNPPSFCWGAYPSGLNYYETNLQSEFLQAEPREADFLSFYRKLIDRCITETHLALGPPKKSNQLGGTKKRTTSHFQGFSSHQKMVAKKSQIFV